MPKKKGQEGADDEDDKIDNKDQRSKLTILDYWKMLGPEDFFSWDQNSAYLIYFANWDPAVLDRLGARLRVDVPWDGNEEDDNAVAMAL